MTTTIESFTARLDNLLASVLPGRGDALLALAGEVSRIAWQGAAQVEAKRIAKAARDAYAGNDVGVDLEALRNEYDNETNPAKRVELRDTLGFYGVRV